MQVQLDQASHVQLSHFTHHPVSPVAAQGLGLGCGRRAAQWHLFLPAQLVSGWGIPRAGGWWGKTS